MILLVISPAKALDFSTPLPQLSPSQPAYLDESEKLVERLRDFSLSDMAAQMGLSDKLAALNVARYQQWQRPFTTDNARPAIFAFDGDVYQGLAATTLLPDAHVWLQQHLRILSGLYGMLKPLDLIQAYRLEMGNRLQNERGLTLYAFWQDLLTEALNATFAAAQTSPLLVNLASNEYFKVIDRKRLNARVITPLFQEWKNGQYKTISFYAKRARGLMSRYAAINQIEDVEALQQFAEEGYAFCPAASTEESWVFRR